MIKKLLCFIIILSAAHHCLQAQAQTSIKLEIENKMTDFASHLSDLNNEYFDNTENIVEKYSPDNYFYFNDSRDTFENFLRKYKRVFLNGEQYMHSFNINSINKRSKTNDDERWEIKATLKRENCSGEDFVVLETDIEFIVMLGRDNNIKILEIDFNPILEIVRPVIETEYKFTASREFLYISENGDEWSTEITSKEIKYKLYPNTNKPKVQINKGHDNCEFSYESKTLTDNKDFKLRGSRLEGSLRGNYTQSNRTHTITLTQKKSNKKIVIKIDQGHFKRWHEKIAAQISDIDDIPNSQFDLIYSLKYNLGISTMFRVGESRFALGGLIACNFASFRGLENGAYAKASVDISFVAPTLNGYKIYKETVYPENCTYSSLMDPYNEAKHYIARNLFLIQGGVYAFEWLRFDLGLGAASKRNLYFMETAPLLEKYSYIKTDESLPDIDDVYSYKAYYKDYYYKDRSETWYFAMRPAMNILIPFDAGYNELYLNLGVGYTHVFNKKDACSIDFSLGIGFEY